MNEQIPFAQVVQLAIAAGEKIMDVYRQDFDVIQKADASPLTAADLAAHKVIVEGLAQLTPSVPVLSEESANIPWAERQAWGEYWLVDPLDGTKEFIKKNGEFTVNIALIRGAEPVWGVVRAPALDVTYVGGVASGGSKKISGGQEIDLQVASLPPTAQGWCIVGSRSHQSDEFTEFVRQFEAPEITSMGSSLKICLVAEAKAHLYPRLGPTSEWDTGAAHAVLSGAGGKLVDISTGQSVAYNIEQNILNPNFIAAPKDYRLA